jgi:hypothetical protein
VFDDQAHRHQQLLLVEDHVPASRFEVADCVLPVGRRKKRTGSPDLVGPQFRVILVGHAAHHQREAREQRERGLDD